MEVISVKFKGNTKVYDFLPSGTHYNIGDSVVVESGSGMCVAKVVDSNHNIDGNNLTAPLDRVIRIATDNDLNKLKNLESKSDEIMQASTRLIKKYKLDMKVVNVDFTLDGNKVIITYVCEERVDFRELVKELAGVLKKRIELRQIGIRDYAKVVGGIGACGQQACCSKFLNDFEKVSVKMAKTQNLSLNPSKISGVCGRLMCCLSYENEGYADTQKYMPKVGTKVTTPDGESGVVIYNNLLKKTTDVKINAEHYTVKNFEARELKYQGKALDDRKMSAENFVQESDKKCAQCKCPHKQFIVQFNKDLAQDDDYKQQVIQKEVENLVEDSVEVDEMQKHIAKPTKKDKYKKRFGKNNGFNKRK